ncbi:hypothetical protein F5888DRAFT_1610248 [Russula emetica]|nr:hypothetical protein F5888DRAFT_1610248 [Russula emetica]
MSSFTFDFDLEDDLDESFDVITPQTPATASSIDTTLVSESAPGGGIPAEEIPLSTLLSALPEAFSYSPITLPASAGSSTSSPGHTLVRRDLFDVRFQLSLSHEQPDEQTTAFVDAPADLVPGTYEGGLKTWECALDLAAYLDRDVLKAQAGVAAAAGRRVHGSRVLELGCGTAVPTLLLLDRLFAYLAFEPGTSTGPPSIRETHIHLQDYNRSVLELVTFPNVLLAWYMSPLSAVYRASATDSDSDLDGNEDENEEGKEATRGSRVAHGRKPGGLTVTQGLLDAFTASLDAHKVRLCFFAGSWASLREKLAHQGKPPYDIVLASETIYRPQSLDAFLSVLCTATAKPAAVAVSDEVVQPPLCLVAAKVLYFGVGGGVQGFVRAVEGENGTLRTVWEHREGVGRIIMQVEW